MGRITEEIIKRDGVKVEKGYLHAYGWTWKKERAPTLLRMNLKAFQEGRTPKEGGLGKLQHYINCVDLLWNEDHSRMKFDWHPWALDFAKAACENPVLAVGGCASSGKSHGAGAWALVNWLADPFNTMVLVTSTSLKDSKKRIWGTITDMFNAIPGLPGKLVPSMGLIRTVDPAGKKEASERCGLALIAGEKKREKEAVGKLIGFKAQRVFVVADELPELSEALIDAYFANIAKNPESGLIGLGNPATFFDAFGRLSEPKPGWDSVSAEDHEWETKSGKFIRFDGFRSPNIEAGFDKYPYLFRQQNLDDDISRYGEDSAIVWRMDRGYFSPIGNEDCIYSSGDIIKYKAMHKVKWLEPPITVAALDPSFTTGGDRTMLSIGEYGKNVDGMKTLCYKKFTLITEDASNKDEPRNFQIARQVVAHLRKEQVSVTHFAMDTTGAGDVLADIIVTMMGKGFHRVTFSGAASDAPVSNFDQTPSNEKYTNRVTQLWFAGRDLIRTGQLKGITTEMAAEMVARRYTVAKGSSARVTAESKPDMKARTGSSPDIGDSAFVLLCLCYEKLGMVSTAKAAKAEGARKSWKQLTQRYSMVAQAGRSLVRS